MREKKKRKDIYTDCVIWTFLSDFSTRTENTWERLRSTSPETPPIKITRLTFPLSSSPSSFPSASTEKISHRNRRIRNHAMDGMDNKPVLNDDPSVTLTIRLIMQGKVSCRITVYIGYTLIEFKLFRWIGHRVFYNFIFTLGSYDFSHSSKNV